MRCLRPLLLLLALTHPAAAGWPSLAEPTRDAARPGRKDGALIIAIEDYLLVDDVEGARANAADWDQWFDARGVPVSRVVVLRDAEAVRESILRQAKQLATEMPAGGTLWVVYIGHGAPSADGQDGVLVGADAQQRAEILYARSVGRKELLTALKGGKQAETVLVLDACFSGKSTRGGALVPGLQPLIPATLSAEARVTILTAGAGDEFAGGLPGAGRPAFSYLMLGALNGWREADGDDDGAVTLGEAVAYSRGALRRLVTDHKQTPEILGPLASLKVARAQLDGPDLRAVGRPAGQANVPPMERIAPPVERSAPPVERIVERPVAEGPPPERPRVATSNQAAPTGTPGPVDTFTGVDTWTGQYICGQGKTDMVLKLTQWDAQGAVAGTFAFRFAAKGVNGAFNVRGRYDATRRVLKLQPGDWIARPDNYNPVALEGTVSGDGHRISGRILDPACGGFEVAR